jgi:hypothetical protein
VETTGSFGGNETGDDIGMIPLVGWCIMLLVENIGGDIDISGGKRSLVNAYPTFPAEPIITSHI